MTTSTTLRDSYRYCLRLTRERYENFPVASYAIPRQLRPHIAAVYAFARSADDFADEGDDTSDKRLEKLEQWRQQLEQACLGKGEGPVFTALADTLQKFKIPGQLFQDLLDAFSQDVVKSSYDTFHEVLAYCSRSANPVGRIVLALHGQLNDYNAKLSDYLCTGLQLANFWQDISVDRLKPRVYLPLEDLHRFGVKMEDVLHGKDSRELQECIAFQIDRSKDFFRKSEPLFDTLPLRLRIEIRAVYYGGRRILEKIEKQNYTTIIFRPKLGFGDVLSMMSYALLRTTPYA